jgi:NADH dehydrogenase
LRGGDDTVETVDRQGNRSLIDAAKAANVQQFVFVSAYGATLDSPVPFLRAKAETEASLRASGMPYTVLAPNRPAL